MFIRNPKSSPNRFEPFFVVTEQKTGTETRICEHRITFAKASCSQRPAAAPRRAAKAMHSPSSSRAIHMYCASPSPFRSSSASLISSTLCAPRTLALGVANNYQRKHLSIRGRRSDFSDQHRITGRPPSPPPEEPTSFSRLPPGGAHRLLGSFCYLCRHWKNLIFFFGFPLFSAEFEGLRRLFHLQREGGTHRGTASP